MRKNRGQTLVLFALTMLLLTLMVTLTLAIGTKTREKIEAQTVADAAAYSEAVLTARTFNTISLLNRTLVSHAVAMTAVESLISWSGYYRGVLNATRTAYWQPFGGYGLIAACACNPYCAPNPPLCRCAIQAMRNIRRIQGNLQRENNTIQQRWQNLDSAAGRQARRLQLGSIHNMQREIYTRLYTGIGGQRFAQKIANLANQGSPFPDDLSAPSGGSLTSIREIGGQPASSECPREGATCPRREEKQHLVYAAMGSRGDAFVTGRSRGAALIMGRIYQRRLLNRDAFFVTNDGSGYFAPEMSHSARVTDNTSVYADDHGTLLVTHMASAPCPPLPGVGSPRAHVRSTDLGDTPGREEHSWTGGNDGADPEWHTFGRCTKCPGMWPGHMDYNQNYVAREDNNFGQPKLYTVMQRDLNRRSQPDPWNLMFNFRFTQSGSGEDFDNRGLTLSDGTNISRPTVVGSAIAYYHRTGTTNHWLEPPNFMNPFWRATLIHPDVDYTFRRDMRLTLGGSRAMFAQDAFNALLGVGYEGW